MKMVLADLASECFDESIELGEYNEMTAKIQRRVLAQIKDDQRRKHFAMRQALSIAIIAAVLVSLLTVTAYALGLFKLNKNHIPEEVTVHGEWIERDSEGNITDIQNLQYPGANLVFTYDCEAVPHYVEIKPGWLPTEGRGWGEQGWGTEGWFQFYHDEGDSACGQILYNVDVFYAVPGFQLVMMYQSEIVEETTWGEYEVTKIINHNPHWNDGAGGDDNYVLLFSPEHGYMIRVGGCLDMETLEKIAQNLEVRILDEEVEYDPDYNIGIINVGRG